MGGGRTGGGRPRERGVFFLRHLGGNIRFLGAAPGARKACGVRRTNRSPHGRTPTHPAAYFPSPQRGGKNRLPPWARFVIFPPPGESGAPFGHTIGPAPKKKANRGMKPTRRPIFRGGTGGGGLLGEGPGTQFWRGPPGPGLKKKSGCSNSPGPTRAGGGGGGWNPPRVRKRGGGNKKGRWPTPQKNGGGWTPPQPHGDPPPPLGGHPGPFGGRKRGGPKWGPGGSGGFGPPPGNYGAPKGGGEPLFSLGTRIRGGPPGGAAVVGGTVFPPRGRPQGNSKTRPPCYPPRGGAPGKKYGPVGGGGVGGTTGGGGDGVPTRGGPHSFQKPGGGGGGFRE
jgi:hypothetical protein